MIPIIRVSMNGETSLQILKKAKITGKTFIINQLSYSNGYVKTIDGNLYYRNTYDYADSLIIGYEITYPYNNYLRNYWLYLFSGLSLRHNGVVKVCHEEANVPKTFYRNLIRRVRRLEKVGVKIILTPERIKHYA